LAWTRSDFDTSDFSLSEQEIVRSRTESVRAWSTVEGDGVGLFFFSLPPDLAGPIDDLASIRQQYRRGGAAIIEVEPLNQAVSSLVRRLQSFSCNAVPATPGMGVC